LPRRWMDTQRQADRIDHDMQFDRQPTARTTNGGTLSPPFAPAASA
jgi:hypothetical protein